MSTEWSEADLEELRAVFYQEGRFKGLLYGGSLITHPDSDDPNQQSLYAGCAELERRGLLRSRVLPNGRSAAFFGPRDPEWDKSSDS